MWRRRPKSVLSLSFVLTQVDDVTTRPHLLSILAVGPLTFIPRPDVLPRLRYILVCSECISCYLFKDFLCRCNLNTFYICACKKMLARRWYSHMMPKPLYLLFLDVLNACRNIFPISDIIMSSMHVVIPILFLILFLSLPNLATSMTFLKHFISFVICLLLLGEDVKECIWHWSHYLSHFLSLSYGCK